MRNKFCDHVLIYGLADPQTGELRYIGKTVKTLQARWHIHKATARAGHPWHVCRWWRQIEGAGVLPEIFEIELVARSEWQESERFWINYFRSIGCHLTNMTPGGDGTDGYKWPEETKRRHAESQKANPRVKQAVARARAKIQELAKSGALRGKRVVSEEQKQKYRETMARNRADGKPRKKRKPASPETLERLSAASKKKWERPGFRENQSVSHIGKRFSPESLAKREASRKRSEEAKRAAGVPLRSPEGRANILAAQQRRRERERALGIPGAPPPTAKSFEALIAGRRRRAEEHRRIKSSQSA